MVPVIAFRASGSPTTAFMCNVGLSNLETLKNLQKLVLIGTQVTDVGVDDLKQALPDLEVIN